MTNTEMPVDRELALKLPLKSLVTIDNSVNRRLIQKILAHLGYESNKVILAIDGEDATQKYAESLIDLSGPIDLILIDLRLPQKDGYETVNDILEMSRAHGLIPAVFALTIDALSETRAQIEAAGMAGYLVRPWRLIDVQSLLVGHFGAPLGQATETSDGNMQIDTEE